MSLFGPNVIPGDVRRSSDDLWKAAVGTLSEDMRRIIDVNPGDKRSVLETVLFEAKRQRQLCLRKQWKITKRNGDVLILRDVFEKIITWVDKFKKVGDVAIQAAPSYAAIPWQVVGFLLKVSIDNNEIFAAMIDGLQTVTNIIARNAIFEDVYFQQETSASHHLTSSLIALYASVLKFLGATQRYFSGNTAVRVIRSVFQLSVSDLEDAVAEIETKQREVDRTAQIAGMEILYNTSTGVHQLTVSTGSLTSQLEALSSQLVGVQPKQDLAAGSATMRQAIAAIMGPTQRILEVLNRWDDSLEIKAREDAFEWLSPMKYKMHHRTERKDRLSQSGEWMFQSEEYRNWQSSSISATLWLHGMPGCGKTKLASAVIDYELEKQALDRSQSIEPAPFAYFYCSRNKAERERADPHKILRCIARQLCEDDTSLPLADHFRNFYEAMGSPKSGEDEPPSDQVLDLILRMLSENPATIVIDALDECDPITRYQLFESLDRIVKTSANVVKVFLTSRNDGDIVCRLETTPNIYIDAQKNKSDIERFVSAEVQKAVSQKRLLNGHISSDLRHQICSTLDREAQGMFRWVSLQIQNLSDPGRMKVKEDIIHELSHLPKTFSDLYSIAFDQITKFGNSSFRLARASFQLLIAAVVPLGWTDLLLLLSVPESGMGRPVSKQEVLDIASNFLEDDKGTDRPRFVHSSAREYLETRSEFHPEMANVETSRICLDNIRHSSSHKACHYSFFYLGDHLSATTSASRLAAREALDRFLVQPCADGGNAEDDCVPSLFRSWRRSFERLPSRRGGDFNLSYVAKTPSLAVCAWGLEEYLDRLPGYGDIIQRRWKVEHWEYCVIGTDSCQNKTSLEIAILFDRPQIIRQLHSLNILQQCRDTYNFSGDTLLHLAVRRGSVGMTEVLLDCGANPNLLNIDGVQEDMCRFGAIAPLGTRDDSKRSKTSMGFRGPRGITSPFAISNTGLAPVHLTVDRRNGLACLRVLLQYGADPNLRTSNDKTPLQLALDAGQYRKPFIEALVAAGADVNAGIDAGQTVLHLAAGMGLSETVISLLAAGADPTIKDWYQQTPYDLAMRSGRRTTAQLVHCGSDVGRGHLQVQNTIYYHRQGPGSIQEVDTPQEKLSQLVIEDYESPAALSRVHSDGQADGDDFFTAGVQLEDSHPASSSGGKSKSKRRHFFKKLFPKRRHGEAAASQGAS